MGFTVDTAALAGLPRMLDRLGEDAEAGRTYLERNARLSGGEDLFKLIVGGHHAVVAKVAAFFGQAAGPVAGRQSAAVQAAIAYYRTTDLRASASFDATLPSVAAPWLEPGKRSDPGFATVAQRSGASFADRAEPQSALVTPAGLGTVDKTPGLDPLLSAAQLGREAVWIATELAAKLGLLERPVDVYLELARPFAGDWNGLQRVSEVLRNLGVSATMMGSNAGSAAVDTQLVWTGNAADGCRDLLQRTGLALDTAAEPLGRLAEQYHETAERVLELAAELAEILTVIVDLAVFAAAEAAADAATAETIIGGVVFTAAELGTLAKLAERVHKANSVVETATAVCKMFLASLDAFHLSTGQPLPELPAGASALPSAPTHKPS